jgi:hypothetical protein
MSKASMGESFKIRGIVEVFCTKGKPEIKPQGNRTLLPKNHPLYNHYQETPHYDQKCLILPKEGTLIDHFVKENIILFAGKNRIIDSLDTGFMRLIGRMAIGDRGTIPSDSTSPKAPTADMTMLYNEVHRTDIQLITKTMGAGVHDIQFVNTFSALDVPLASMSDQTNPKINEVALIMVDGISGDPLPRGPVSAPNLNAADEELFSIRTFKSVPFDQAQEIAITIRYTISVE